MLSIRYLVYRAYYHTTNVLLVCILGSSQLIETLRCIKRSAYGIRYKDVDPNPSEDFCYVQQRVEDARHF